jgi:hypothetical protein
VTLVDLVRNTWARLSLAGRGVLLVATALVVGLLVAALAGVFGSDPSADPAEVSAAARGEGEDPYAFEQARVLEFQGRGAGASADVLYEKSPGGVIASAERTAEYRDEVEQAAESVGADPDLMEAMIFLESAGRPEVIAGDDPSAASGLAQIVASTGIALLGMEIDLARSQELSAAIDAIPSRGEEIRDRRDRLSRQAQRVASVLDSPKRSRRKAARKKSRTLAREMARLTRELEGLPKEERRFRRERRDIDPRFDPVGAIAGMARYLEIAQERFGREDLAIASYHMGIGNLENVIRRYVRPRDSSGPIGPIVERDQLSFAQLYFDTSPVRNPKTWELIDSFGDDSATYLWRVLASLEIMDAFRSDPGELERLAELYTAKSTAEEVFHPESETEVFADPESVAEARRDGELVELPGRPQLDFRPARQLGELARELGAEKKLYRALRPEALAALIYLSSQVQAITGRDERLVVTSAVRDRAYQQILVTRNRQATPEYSLHTTGWAFDIWRRYESDAQAAAFQFVLDRMRALGVIDYAVEPDAIHVTVSGAPELLAG